jgi:hypothetical protein
LTGRLLPIHHPACPLVWHWLSLPFPLTE